MFSALPMVTLTALQLRNIEEQLKTLKQEGWYQKKILKKNFFLLLIIKTSCLKNFYKRAFRLFGTIFSI